MKILIIEDEYKLADAISEILKKEKIDTPVIILTANVKKVQKHLPKTWKIEKRTFIRLKSLITKVLLFNAFKKLEKNNTKFYITAFSF